MIHTNKQNLWVGFAICLGAMQGVNAQSILLSDDFNGNSLSSAWTVERGNAVVGSGTLTTFGDNPSYPSSRDACVEAGNSSWRDYTLTTSVYARTNPSGWAPYYASYIWIRNQDQHGWGLGTFYGVTIVPPGGSVYGNSQIQFFKTVNSIRTYDSGFISVPILTAGYNGVQISAIGNTFDITINGNNVYSYTDNDNPIMSGGVAVGGIWEGLVSYDHVQVVGAAVPEVQSASLTAGIGLLGYSLWHCVGRRCSRKLE